MDAINTQRELDKMASLLTKPIEITANGDKLPTFLASTINPVITKADVGVVSDPEMVFTFRVNPNQGLPDRNGDIWPATHYYGDAIQVIKCKSCKSGLVSRRVDGSFPDKCWQCGGGN